MAVRSVFPGFIPLLLAAFIGTMAMMAFVAVIGPVVRVLGLAEWHAGLSVTAAGVLWMASARRWGALSDRLGRRAVLLIGMSGYAVVYIALALFVDAALASPPALLLSVSVLVGARAVVGLFYAAVPPATAALVADHVPAGERGTVMAGLGTANALGMVIGPAVAGWIAFQSLSLALYVAAALPLLALAVVWLRLPAMPRSMSGSAVSRRLAWFDPRLRLPVMAVFATMVAVTIAQVAVGFFAIDRLQLSPAAGARLAGLALTAVGGALILAQVLVMKLGRVQPRQWIAIGAMLSALGFGAVALVAQPWHLLLTYAMAAFGMGFVFPAFQALAADSVTADEQGAAAGTVAAVQGMGMVAGPLLGTLLYRLWPSLPYLLVAVVLALLSLAAFRHR